MSPLTLSRAKELLATTTDDPHLIVHAVNVSACMEAMARQCGMGAEEAAHWAAVGYLHDYDYQRHPEEHLAHTEAPLLAAGVDPADVRAIVSHGWSIVNDVKPETPLEKSLFTVDELSGLVWAAALMRPNRILDLEPKSVVKKFKDKRFAAKCDREVIRRGLDLLGMDLSAVVAVCIEGMRPHAAEIGLLPPEPAEAAGAPAEPEAAAPTVEALKARVLGGGAVTREEALWLLSKAPRKEFRDAAHEITAACSSHDFDFCGIVSARQGRCSENCKWCAQSAHYRTGCETHGWIGAEACLEAAREAEKNGVRRFGIVTSGRGQTDAQVDELCEAFRAIAAGSHIERCASLGLVTEEQLRRLREAGLRRLHCNLETAPSRFPSLCSTHAPADKLATIRAAKKLGYDICCGGIIGMGETDEELVEFAFAIREVGPVSIPVNILHPIPGTPLGASAPLGIERILDAIAILRFVNPRPSLRFAGGRRDLSDDDARRCIYVGINAGIAGPLLTTPGAVYADDRALALEAGYTVAPAPAS